jgi:hypothetical protein
MNRRTFLASLLAAPVAAALPDVRRPSFLSGLLDVTLPAPVATRIRDLWIDSRGPTTVTAGNGSTVAVLQAGESITLRCTDGVWEVA